MSFFHSPEMLAILLFSILIIPEVKSAHASVPSPTTLDVRAGMTSPGKSDPNDPKFPADWQIQSFRMCQEAVEMLKNEVNPLGAGHQYRSYEGEEPDLCTPEAVQWYAWVKDDRVHYEVTFDFGLDVYDYITEDIIHKCWYSQPFPVLIFNPKLEDCDSWSAM